MSHHHARRRRPTRAVFAVALLWLGLLAASPCLLAQRLEAPFFIEGDARRPLAPGAETTLTLRARAAVGGVSRIELEGDRALAGYVVKPLDPASCGLWTFLPPSAGRVRVEFATSLASGATCRYQLQRAFDSRDDLQLTPCLALQFGSPFCFGAAVQIGTLPDLSLGAVLVEGFRGVPGTAIARITVTNRSAVDVIHRDFTTGCRDFSGGISDFAPFDLDGGFPGACAVAPSDGCVFFTGQNDETRDFRVGPIPAGGSTSCLVRLRRPAGAPSGGLPIRLFRAVPRSDGGLAFDGDAANDGAVLAGTLDPLPVPLGALVPIALAGLFGAVGAIRLRRRRHRD